MTVNYALNMIIFFVFALSVNSHAEDAHIRLRGSSINDYRDKLNLDEIDELDAFLSVLRQKLKQGDLKFPRSFAVGNHKVGDNTYHIPREIKVISEDKIFVILNDVIYAVNNSPKIVGAYELQGQRHAVKRDAGSAEYALYQLLDRRPLEGVVKVYGIQKSSDKNTVFMKRYKDGDLYKILSDIKNKKREPFSDKQKLKIIEGIIRGLAGLHKLSIANRDAHNKPITVPLSHRDIKGANIFCENTSCDLGDFDLATYIKNISGTAGFFSPETLKFVYEKSYNGIRDALNFNFFYGQKSDIWALGLVIASVLASNPEAQFDLQAIKKTTEKLDPKNNLHQALLQKPFVEDVLSQLMTELESQKAASSNPAIKKAWDLVKQMLNKDPDLRPRAEAALKQLQES